MLDRSSIKNQLMNRRSFIILAGKLGFIGLLASRMFYMQFIKKDEYRTLSDNNRIKILILTPKRGEIFDVKDKLIAQNESCFRLVIDKQSNRDFKSEIELINKVLELGSNQIQELDRRVKMAGYRIPAIIIDMLDWKQVSSIEERHSDFKALSVETGSNRNYKYPQAVAHLLGYLSRPLKASEKPTKNLDDNFKIGKSGIEKQYEEHLRGDFGIRRLEVNARGKYVRQLDINMPTDGKALNLNINIDLQTKVQSFLSKQGASAIVMDCTSGALLASASSPSFDPNNFNNLSSNYWHQLITNPYHPIIDKTIRSLYPPGSVFKIITILAALDHGISPDEKFKCTGVPFLGGNSFRCARSRGHGYLNMHDAIKHSCNYYIYHVARIIGVDKIIKIAKEFGFGSKTNIDLPGELTGFIPTKEWKKKRFNSAWRLGDTLNMSIGQGFVLATPMQLASMITTVASEGKLYQPRIVQSESVFKEINIPKEHFSILKKALFAVINEHGGTGHLSRINGSIKLSAKTGTAQVRAKKNLTDNLSSLDVAWHSRNHAIFTGYLPHDNPKYSITVYFDHGGGGGRAAAPIAKKIAHELIKHCF